MAASDPLQILLAHDRWATAQILQACTDLSDDAFHRRFEIGPGSLHDALTHMVSVMRLWTDGLAGRDQRPRLEPDGRRRTPAELLALFDDAARDLAAEAVRLPLDGTIARTRDGRTFTFTRGAVLAHVATHAVHHRAQCLNMLRQLGVQPLPPSSVAEWTWARE